MANNSDNKRSTASAAAREQTQAVPQRISDGENTEFPDSELDELIREWKPDKPESPGVQAQFEVYNELPRAMVQQKNGDFLDKVEYDKDLLDPQCDEERDPRSQKILVLIGTGSYMQPSTSVWFCKKMGMKEEGIDDLFRKASLLPPDTYRDGEIKYHTMIRCPKNPHRFLDASKLRYEQPDAMVMADHIFFQNGTKAGNLSGTGNFRSLAQRISRAMYNKPLLPAQLEFLEQMKRATAEAMSSPQFVWPSGLADSERKDLARQSWLGTLTISDSLLGRVGLRLTFQVPSHGTSREPSPSETSDDSLPLFAPLGILLPDNENFGSVRKRKQADLGDEDIGDVARRKRKRGDLGDVAQNGPRGRRRSVGR